MRRIPCALLLIIGTLATAEAQVRLEVPTENQGPFYARLMRVPYFGFFEEIHHDDQWAAIAFYRDPACIPQDYNLLELFDWTPDPVYGLRPFGCALAVEGFEIWRNGPGTTDPAPFFSRLSGLGGVEVWFVSWPALQAEVQDGQLTIGELAAMPSLRRGIATLFSETLRPGEAAQAGGMITIEAHGTTEDGARFFFHTLATGVQPVCCSSGGKRQQVIIRFW